MQITVNIPDEVVAAAQASGLTLEKYVEQVLTGSVAAKAAPRFHSEQEIQSWIDSLSQFSEKIAPMPETISREWLYQDHD